MTSYHYIQNRAPLLKVLWLPHCCWIDVVIHALDAPRIRQLACLLSQTTFLRGSHRPQRTQLLLGTPPPAVDEPPSSISIRRLASSGSLDSTIYGFMPPSHHSPQVFPSSEPSSLHLWCRVPTPSPKPGRQLSWDHPLTYVHNLILNDMMLRHWSFTTSTPSQP